MVWVRRLLTFRLIASRLSFCVFLAGLFMVAASLEGANAQNNNGERQTAPHQEQQHLQQQSCASQLASIDEIRLDLPALEQLVTRCSSAAEAHYTLGIAQRNAGKLVEARRSLRAAADRSPLSIYRIALGSVALELGEVDEASQAFAKVLENEPRAVGALIGRALVAARTKGWEQSLGFLERALAIEPSNEIALFNRAAVFERLSRFRDAVADYARVTELAPHNSIGWCRLGFLRFALRDDSGARGPLSRCAELAGGSGNGSGGAAAPAADDMNNAGTSLNDRIRSSLLLALLNSESGDHERAELLLRRLAEQYPNVAEIKLGLAETYLAMRRFEAARQQARLATALASKRPVGWELLGRAALELGDIAEADSALTRARSLREAQPNASLLNDLGVVRLRQGAREEATALFAEAVTLAESGKSEDSSAEYRENLERAR